MLKCIFFTFKCVNFYHVTYAFQSESTFYTCLNVKEILAQNRCKIWSLSDCNWTWTHNHFFRKQTNDWAVLWVVIHTMHLTVCSYHVTYAFQSESKLYSCLNIKELLATNRCKIWSLSDCNWTQTHNHLVHKWTLNHLVELAKWLSCGVSTYLYDVYACMFFLSCHLCFLEWIHSL